MNTTRFALTSLSGLLALTGSALAQPSIDWFTVDGGGGTSVGATFAVTGTIGQPDAGGPMTGSTFSVTGGFWTEDVGGGAPAGCNLADVTEIGGTAEAPGVPDNQLTVDDVIVFVNLFGDGTGCPGAAPCSLADVCGIGGPPEPSDGELTVDDVIGFFNAFSDGC